MENINNIIVLLVAIQNFAKDIHYNAKGDAFYSKHLLCDRIQENISDYIDSIKEVCFLPADKEPLTSKYYLKQASELIPDIQNDDKNDFIALSLIIMGALREIESLKDLSKGEDNLFGAIAENLQVSYGLIKRQVK